MGEKHFFGEGAFDAGDGYRGRDAGEVGEAGVFRAGEDERDEGGAWFTDGDVELAGDIVAESGRSHFGDGEASGGDDECGCAIDGVLRGDVKAVVAVDCADVCAEDDSDVSGGTFGEEQVDDLIRGAVAEKLAEGFLVVANAMVLDEGDEVGGGVAGERGFREMGIGGEEIFRTAVEVGEVTAASAGDEDFFTGAVGAFEESDASVAAARFDGGHEAGGAGADDEDIEGVGWVGRHGGAPALLEHWGARNQRPEASDQRLDKTGASRESHISQQRRDMGHGGFKVQVQHFQEEEMVAYGQDVPAPG
jgi:hypothetical protein